MKVLVVSQYFWPETFIVNDLVKLLHDRGVNVTVLTGKPNYPGGQIFKGYQAGGLQIEQYNGTTVLRLPIIARGKHSRFRLVLNYLSFIFAGFLLGPRLVRDHDYDLVFVYAPSPLLQALPAIWLASIRQVPLVLWVQDLWPESLIATGHVSNRWLLSAVALVVRLIYRASDRILVQSRAFIAPVAKLTDDPKKIYYYPNLFKNNTAYQTSERALKLVKTLNAHFSVVFAGNLGAVQALDTIVEAAYQLLPYSQIRIVLVGSGSQDAWLAQQREAYGLNNLILADRFEVSDMPAIFNASQALLVSLRPDPALLLTIPSKVQAYLAAGIPILASLDGEGARIIEESGAGFCSAAGKADALADSILRLARLSEEERKAMGKSGRAYFDRHFAPELLAGELLEHFEQMVTVMEKNQ